MIQQKVLAAVHKGMQYVPSPLRTAMRTKTAMVGCVVVGGAFTAYGTGKCSGSEAIAGVAIGAGTIALDKIPVGKILSAGVGLLKRK